MNKQATVIIDQSQKNHLDNIIRLLAKGEVKFQGASEILAASEALRWLSSLQAQVDKKLKEVEVVQPVKMPEATVVPEVKPANSNKKKPHGKD